MPNGLCEASVGATDYGAGASPLEQSRPRMILEQFSVADVTPESIYRLVQANIHHLEDRRALAGCGCKKASPQGMARE